MDEIELGEEVIVNGIPGEVVARRVDAKTRRVTAVNVKYEIKGVPIVRCFNVDAIERIKRETAS